MTKKATGCEELSKELFAKINNLTLTIHTLWEEIKLQEEIKTKRNAKFLRVIKSLNKLVCTFKNLPDFKELTSQIPNKKYWITTELIRKNVWMPLLKPNIMFNGQQSIWEFLKAHRWMIAAPAL